MKIYKSMKVTALTLSVGAMVVLGINTSKASCDSHAVIPNDGVCREIEITYPNGVIRRELACGEKILATEVLSCVIGGLAGPG